MAQDFDNSSEEPNKTGPDKMGLDKSGQGETDKESKESLDSLSKKNKKKDLFSASIRDSLDDKENPTSNIGEFVGNLQNDKQTEPNPVEQEVPTKEEKNHQPPNDLNLTTEDEQNSPSVPEAENKKELSPAPQNKISLSKMEENKLKKIDPKYITKSDIKYEDGSGRGRVFVIVAAIFLAMFGAYFLFFSGEKSQSKILLANSEISNFKDKPKESYSFTLGKPLYIHVDSGDSFGVERIQINIVEQKAAADNKANLNIVGTYTFSVKPTWESVSTHFQKDYFVKKGDYVISVSKPNGVLIASQKFKIN